MKRESNVFAIMFICIMFLFFCYGCVDKPSESTYTVTFETNGGSKITDKSCLVIEVPPTTIRDDYNFSGWFFDTSFTRPVAFPLSVDSDMKLYAKWEKTKEKIISDCMSYIDNQNDQKLVLQEERSFDYGVDELDITVTHIGDTFNFEWRKVRHIQNVIYRHDLDISFEYGNLESAKGYLYYYYFFLTEDNLLLSDLFSLYRITSIEKSGDTYLLKGYFTIFDVSDDYNKTELEVESSFQTEFHLSLYDFQDLFPVEYWKTLFCFTD